MKKPKVLIYADSPGWAYDNICKFLKEKFKDDYDWYYDYTICHKYTFKTYSLGQRLKADIINLNRFLFKALTFKGFKKISVYTLLNYQLTFFWKRAFKWNGEIYSRRILPFWSQYDVVILLDYYFDRVARLNFRTRRLVKGLYFDGFPPPGCKYDFITKQDPALLGTLKQFSDEYLNDVDAIVAGSPTIAARFKQYFENIHFCNAIYREEIFIEKESFLKQPDEPFIIGWTGNPLRDFKNFKTIVEPVVHDLKELGLNVFLKTRFSGSYETLPQFYSDVDLILIASEKDAGPFMFSEASLSGVPSISTSVGFPAYVIKQMVNGIIVPLDSKAFADNITYLYKNRDVLYAMSKRIRADYLEKMGSDVLVNNWRTMFKSLKI
jgi:glycosyltransferase involved in cell wall biosynthesis